MTSTEDTMADAWSPPAGSRTVRALGRLDPLSVATALIVVALVPVALTTDRFLSVDNAQAILAATAITGITAIGATLVMIAGSAVSLSTSQTATVVAMIFLSTQDQGLGAALGLALLCGAVIAGLQGAVVGYWAANPIVLTIASGFAITGAATWMSGGTPVYAEGKAYDVLNTTLLGLPVSVYALLLLAVVAEWVLRRTTVGRQMYLVGENRPAARAAGLPVGRVTLIAWTFMGVCIAVTGIFLASFHTSANVELGGNLTLDAIAAVLVGGTAISGGRGSAVRTLGGAVLISVIADIALLRDYSTGVQILAKGLLVLLVVVLVHLRSTGGRR